MHRKYGFLLLTGMISAVIVVGCRVPTEDEVKKEVSTKLETAKQETVKQANGIAKSAWVRAQEEATKLGATSPEVALLDAKNRLQQIQGDLANVKLREPVDDFRSAYVEEQIARLDAALDLKEVRTKMDAAVAEAKKLPANATKTDAEIRQKLADAQKSFREMQAQYEIANHNLQAAENTITSIRQEIQKLGGVLPK